VMIHRALVRTATTSQNARIASFLFVPGHTGTENPIAQRIMTAIFIGCPPAFPPQTGVSLTYVLQPQILPERWISTSLGLLSGQQGCIADIIWPGPQSPKCATCSAAQTLRTGRLQSLDRPHGAATHYHRACSALARCCTRREDSRQVVDPACRLARYVL